MSKSTHILSKIKVLLKNFGMFTQKREYQIWRVFVLNRLSKFYSTFWVES